MNLVHTNLCIQVDIEESLKQLGTDLCLSGNIYHNCKFFGKNFKAQILDTSTDMIDFTPFSFFLHILYLGMTMKMRQIVGLLWIIRELFGIKEIFVSGSVINSNLSFCLTSVVQRNLTATIAQSETFSWENFLRQRAKIHI